MLLTRPLLATGAAIAALVGAAKAQQTPPALAAAHVLLISVDGMHEIDLRRYVETHPTSALAQLAARGLTYSNAFTTAPSDSFPGMLAQVTGGTPLSTGVYYDDSYDRTLYAPGSICTGAPGAETTYAENLDRSLADITGGGTLGDPLSQINRANLPLAKVGQACRPVLPHQFVKVNTLFEVVRNHGGHTAWSDKHPAYEILNGPSGTGVEDLYTPEINSQLPGAPDGKDYTSSFAGVRSYDAIKVQSIINQIDGRDSTGATTRAVPTVFGMNFQAVSVGQKLASSGYGDAAGLVGGYLDAAATPGAALAQQLDFVDQSLGRMVRELRRKGLYDHTAIIVSAKHGQSPIDPALRRAVPDAYASVITHGYAFNIADDASLVWLDPATQQQNYAAALADLKAAKVPLGIYSILTRPTLTRVFGDPFGNARTPDFLVVVQHGVIYTGGSKLAEHGGLNPDDRRVALLVSAPGLTGRRSDLQVFTTQIAPTILQTLGLSPAELQAVQIEGTQVLPELF